LGPAEWARAISRVRRVPALQRGGDMGHVRWLRAAWCAALFGAVGVLPGCTVSFDAGDAVHMREEKRFTVSGTPDLTLATFDGPVEICAWDEV